INDRNISSLVQLEYSGFDGATVPICTFTLRNYHSNTNGEYIRLADFRGAANQPIKTLEAIKHPEVSYRYSFNKKTLIRFPAFQLHIGHLIKSLLYLQTIRCYQISH